MCSSHQYMVTCSITVIICFLCPWAAKGCTSDPCQNGGTCTDEMSGYVCACAAGFEGVHCEVDTDECASSPCVNLATCTDQTAGYMCDCTSGITGVHCETNVDECASGPCQNGGTCVDLINDIDCQCPANTVGLLCQTDPCDPSPCLLNGTCEVDSSNPFDYTFTCTCVDGASGDTCDVGPCEDNPAFCQSGATCSNRLYNETLVVAECACVVGYQGADCSQQDSTEESTYRQTDSNKTNKDDFMARHPYVIAVACAAAVAVATCLICMVWGLLKLKRKADGNKNGTKIIDIRNSSPGKPAPTPIEPYPFKPPEANPFNPCKEDPFKPSKANPVKPSKAIAAWN